MISTFLLQLSGFPVSRLSNVANSYLCFSIRQASLESKSHLWLALKRGHVPDSKALFAACTAKSTSFSSADETWVFIFENLCDI